MLNYGINKGLYLGMKKYSSGQRGAPAKGIGRRLAARGFKSLLLRQNICRCSSMVERDLAKVDTRVRFPSSAPLKTKALIRELLIFLKNIYVTNY